MKESLFKSGNSSDLRRRGEPDAVLRRPPGEAGLEC